MMILWRERLAFLAVPKTGTTAIESILAPFAAITYSRPPMVKHMTLQGNRISKVYQERTQEIVVPSSAFKFDTV